jgi:hypothetical protein
MVRRMRRIATAVALIVCLHQGALAEPATSASAGAAATVPAIPPTTPPPSSLSTPSTEEPRTGFTPMDDPAKADPEAGEPVDEPSPWRKRGAALTLGGIYTGFAVWSYIAWYQMPTHEFLFDGDPSDGKAYRSFWLGSKTYAGGADKLGHMWSTYALARAGTEILRAGGFDDFEASLIGAGASETLFLLVEIVDGYHYVFSTGDLAFNTLGAALAVVQSNYPQVDDMIDFRVEYWPSKAYRDHTDADFAEDYSGQTFHVAFHLGSIPALQRSRWSTWSRFVDVDLGFKTRGYKPDPPWEVTDEMPDYEMQQTLSLGVALNLQGVFDYLLEDRAPTARRLTHGAFEIFTPPYTTLPVASTSRSPTGPIPPSPF